MRSEIDNVIQPEMNNITQKDVREEYDDIQENVEEADNEENESEGINDIVDQTNGINEPQISLNDDQMNDHNKHDEQENEPNNNDQMSDNDDQTSDNDDQTDHHDEQTEMPNTEKDKNSDDPKSIERKKRGLPKTMMANQLKYLDALEKQQKMMGKNKKKTQSSNKKDKKMDEPKSVNMNKTNANKEGMRRVIVGGKVKYLPVKEKSNTPDMTSGNKVPKSKPQSPQIPISSPQENISSHHLSMNGVQPIVKKIPTTSSLRTNGEQRKMVNPSELLQKIMKAEEEDSIPSIPKPLPSSLAKKMEIHKAKLAKESTMTTKKNKSSSGSSGKKIPGKYAKQIEKDVKKQTVKNVKNFSDLRRIKAIENITTDLDIDANKASINELRKLRIEQRKKEQADLKKKAEANKRESAVQEILKNDKMSKFAKTVAIKNLSINSRHKKRNPNSPTILAPLA